MIYLWEHTELMMMMMMMTNLFGVLPSNIQTYSTKIHCDKVNRQFVCDLNYFVQLRKGSLSKK